MFLLYGYGLCKGNPSPKIALEGSVPPFWVPETFGDVGETVGSSRVDPQTNSKQDPHPC